MNPSPPGLSLSEGLALVGAAGRRHLRAIDLVEVNPRLGAPPDVARTVAAAVQLLLEAAAAAAGRT